MIMGLPLKHCIYVLSWPTDKEYPQGMEGQLVSSRLQQLLLELPLGHSSALSHDKVYW